MRIRKVLSTFTTFFHWIPLKHRKSVRIPFCFSRSQKYKFNSSCYMQEALVFLDLDVFSLSSEQEKVQRNWFGSRILQVHFYCCIFAQFDARKTHSAQSSNRLNIEHPLNRYWLNTIYALEINSIFDALLRYYRECMLRLYDFFSHSVYSCIKRWYFRSKNSKIDGDGRANKFKRAAHYYSIYPIP